MTVKHFIRTLTTAAFMVAVVTLCGCKRDTSLRVLYWNFQNGMWADEPNNYDNFVEWVKQYNPDVCIWCEAQTIYETGTNKGCKAEERYLVDNWGELAARFGHQYWAKGGHRDNYPQVITSKLPIETVEQIIGEEPDNVVTHGAGHFRVEFNGKKVNIPSYLIKAGDVIAVSEKAASNAFFKKLKEDDAFVAAPKWLDRDKNTLTGKVVAMPTQADIDFDIAVHLIVELYSK